MVHFGLFEGIGGFSFAVKSLGGETAGWVEIEPFCQKVLGYYFPNAVGYGDIRDVDFKPWSGKIDIVTGGFPCQPFSSAGKRLGTEDDRHLFPQMLRAIEEIRPPFVLGENVLGFLNWEKGLVFEQACAGLEALGFEVVTLTLPACGADAPHRRDRIWIAAYSEKNRIHRESFGSSETVGGSVGKETEQFGKRGQIWDAPISKERRRSRDWGNWPSQYPICSGNDGLSIRLAGITFSDWREFALGALGNAIVPEIAARIILALTSPS